MLAVGVRQVVRSRRRPASIAEGDPPEGCPQRGQGPRTVVVAPALRDALLAWCAAPTTRTALGVLAEAVGRAERHARGR